MYNFTVKIKKLSLPIGKANIDFLGLFKHLSKYSKEAIADTLIEELKKWKNKNYILSKQIINLHKIPQAPEFIFISESILNKKSI
jgi:hypothetical protein